MRYFLLLALLLITAPVRAQDCCRVQGVVTDDGGTPIAGGDVTLTSADLKQPKTAATDTAGRYVFEGVRPGIRVTITVAAGGRPIGRAFSLVTEFVENINIKAWSATVSPTTLQDLDPMGGDSAELRGVVLAADRTPLAGVRLAVDGTTADAITDSSGRWSFGRVRSKLVLTVSAKASGFQPATAEITVPATGATDTEFVLTASGPETSANLGLADAVPDRPTLVLHDASVGAVPSVSAPDLFRAGRLLPSGSVGQDESELFVHGSAPGDVRVTLDGASWFSYPRLAGGLVSPIAFTSPSTTAVSAQPAGDAADGLGGDIDVSTARRGDKVSGSAGLNLLGPSGLLYAPLGKIAALTVGGRASGPAGLYEHFLDRASASSYVRDRNPQYTGGTLANSQDTAFSSFNGRFDFTPGPGQRASVSFFKADDSGNYSRDAAVPAPSSDLGVPPSATLPDDLAVQIGDVQSWNGRGLSAEWQRQWSPSLWTTATVARSRFTNGRDQSFPLMQPSTGDELSPAAGRIGSDALSEQAQIEDTTVRVASDVHIRAHAVTAGVEWKTTDSSYVARSETAESLTPLLTRDVSATTTTAFASDVWRPLPLLTVTPAVRLSHDDLSQATSFDPRVSASYAPVPHLVLKGAWSIDHQRTMRIVREDRDHGDGVFWTSADGTTVPAPRAQEASAGASVQVPGVLFEARLFYRSMEDLTIFAPRLLPDAALTDAASAFHHGTGNAAGLEILVQHSLPRNSLWAGYTASRVEYTYPTLQAAAFPASFDRLHQFRFTDSLRLATGWTVNGVWQIASGLPYTGVSGVEQVWFNSGALAYQPVFGTRNALRFPVFHQLDLSSQFAHRLGAVTATVGATVFNLYDRQNPLAYDYETALSNTIVSQTLLTRRALDVFFKVNF